ncbi:hypothetical protein F511_13753 [Dorcoceras hygrometricum]|uniref:Uncharacterized protein n=1 Tax=Dorcoceras hygrometricum TaxID=472368 RepID=A0A2Z7BQW0_9LAMI|nr:hypothetical protein F511_13753 [Dorcoceras hygrometricum]
MTTNRVQATQIHHLLSQHKQLLKDRSTEKQQLRATNSTTAILPHVTQQRAINNTRQALNTYPNKLGRKPTLMLTDYTREMSSHTSPASSKRPKTINEASQQEESNATILTSIGAVYRRLSKKIRSLTLLKTNATNAESSSLIQYAAFQLIQTTTYQLIQTMTFSYSLLKHASALSIAPATTDLATTAEHNHSATTADVTTTER